MFHRPDPDQTNSEECHGYGLAADGYSDPVYEMALRYLSIRPRSEREMRTYFRRKGIAEPESLAVIHRLTAVSLIDDLAFARFWVDQRDHFSPRGNRALVSELRQKGIAAEVIEEALTRGSDEEERAVRVGRKRITSLRTSDRAEFDRRLDGHLARRGFGYDVRRNVLRVLWLELRELDAEF